MLHACLMHLSLECCSPANLKCLALEYETTGSLQAALAAASAALFDAIHFAGTTTYTMLQYCSNTCPLTHRNAREGAAGMIT